MKITVVKDLDEQSKTFKKAEWNIADKEHYGKPVDWDKHEAHYIKAMDRGEVVGLLDLVISHGVANIKDIIINHTRQREGIGKQLMEEAESMARKAGAHKMFLDTGVDWQARHFYEALGYKKEGTLHDHSFHKDFVYYSKKL